MKKHIKDLKFYDIVYRMFLFNYSLDMNELMQMK